MNDHQNQPNWEKLNLDIEMLSTEDPNSTLPILSGLQSVLQPDIETESTFRKINFISYELTAKCEGLSENDRFHILNSYFFDQKDFHLVGNKTNDLNKLFITNVISNSCGEAITVGMLYLHLASHLELPIYMINTTSHHILKWVRGNDTCFIDLSQGGKVLNEDEILKAVKLHCKIDSDSCLEILPPKKLLFNYVSKIYKCLKNLKLSFQALTCLDVLIKLQPSNLKMISFRAMLKKELGMEKEALKDLKKYFSFVDKSQAAPELLMALHELDGNNFAAAQNPELLH